MARGLPYERENYTGSCVFASSEIRLKEDPTGMPGEYNEIMDVKRPRRTSARAKACAFESLENRFPKTWSQAFWPQPSAFSSQCPAFSSNSFLGLL